MHHQCKGMLLHAKDISMMGSNQLIGGLYSKVAGFPRLGGAVNAISRVTNLVKLSCIPPFGQPLPANPQFGTQEGTLAALIKQSFLI